ncbi:hypothetical protein D3C76_1555240 [compost metagenome]
MKHPAHALNDLAFRVAPNVALEQAVCGIVQRLVGVVHVYPEHIRKGVSPDRQIAVLGERLAWIYQ